MDCQPVCISSHHYIFILVLLNHNVITFTPLEWTQDQQHILKLPFYHLLIMKLIWNHTVQKWGSYIKLTLMWKKEGDLLLLSYEYSKHHFKVLRSILLLPAWSQENKSKLKSFWSYWKLSILDNCVCALFLWRQGKCKIFEPQQSLSLCKLVAM